MVIVKFLRIIIRVFECLDYPLLGLRERLYFCAGIKKLKNYQPSKSSPRWSNDTDDQSQKLGI